MAWHPLLGLLEAEIWGQRGNQVAEVCSRRVAACLVFSSWLGGITPFPFSLHMTKESFSGLGSGVIFASVLLSAPLQLSSRGAACLCTHVVVLLTFLLAHEAPSFTVHFAFPQMKCSHKELSGPLSP